MYGENNVDFSSIGNDAQKARLDKKNTDNHSIQMSVAKSKNEWTMFALPFDEYQKFLIKIAETLKK